MIYINEWLPNPVGSDKGSEWVELFNGGANGVPLNGWTLVNGSGKKFFFKEQNIGAGGYLVLKQPLTLRNTDESLSLYDAQGKIADKSSFSGSAPEGQSYSRADGGTFVFSAPTPGAPNKIVKEFLAAEAYRSGSPLNGNIGYLEILGLALFAGLVYSFFITVVFKRNGYLSKLFFGRD